MTKPADVALRTGRVGFSYLEGLFVLFGFAGALSAFSVAGIASLRHWDWPSALIAAPLSALMFGICWFVSPFAVAALAYAVARPFAGVEKADSIYEAAGTWTRAALFYGYLLIAATVLVAVPVAMLVD